MLSNCNLSETLRSRLISTGKSQDAIGKATGLAQTTIGRFLRGVNDISLSNYQKLRAFCDQHEQQAAQSQPVEQA